jgi:alpha-tubulin suppressor-like RCC1 family protein
MSMVRNLRRRRWPGRRKRARGAAAALALAVAGAGLAGTVAGPAIPASAIPLPTVTAGGGHSCALMPDQTVWCWGRNTTGQLGDGGTADSLVPLWVKTLAPATGVSAGHDHTCAVSTGSQVWCWGANAFGELGNGTTSVDHPLPVLVQGIVATQVSAGDGFTCAVTATHTADCWGDNNYGELGDGSTADASTPHKVKGLSNVTQIAAGYFHACALESNGTVWCWGSNTFGALGNGTTTASDVPVKVAIEGAAFVAAGADDSCAILSSGALNCWGSNDVGQLGTGDTTDHHLPTQVAALTSGVQQVSMGEDFSCALANLPGPTAVCWGDENVHGQLGNGHASGDVPVPVRVFGLTTSAAGGVSGPQQLAAGSHHACVVMTTGLAQCWGEGAYGNLGDGSTLDHIIPTPVMGLPGPPHSVSAVTGGDLTSCAVTTAFEADCWGQFVGDGGSETTVHTSATQVVGLPAGGVSQVAAGWGGCALVRLGGLATGLRCWGANNNGQLGNGTTTDTNTPVTVTGLSSHVQAVSNGGSDNCALVHNGGAWCWGYNAYGALGDGTHTSHSTPVHVKNLPLNLAQIATGFEHSCALLAGGTVRCWGKNDHGQLGNGTTSDSATPVTVSGLGGVVQIAVSDSSTCALTNGGGVRCWGANLFGELGNGTTTDSDVPVAVSGLSSGVVAITASVSTVCAALFTGQVQCWGDNAVGELGDGSIGGTATSPVPAVFTGDGLVGASGTQGGVLCGLNTSQQAFCWGDNSAGELGDGTTTTSGSPMAVQGL